MALDLITFQGPAAAEVKERSNVVVRALFNDQRAYAKVQPTNVYYRLDDEGSGQMLQDWTSVTPPVLPTNYVDIALTPEQNRILFESRGVERKTLTVMTDRGLSTQFVGSYTYSVRNLGWPQ